MLLQTETGFRSSAGIACNRMLAKLCSGLHKPDDQTILPPVEASAFVAPLPLRAIPGVGVKLGSDCQHEIADVMSLTLLHVVLSGGCMADGQLKQLGLETVEQVRPWSQAALVQKFGERIGIFLHQACRGLVSPTALALAVITARRTVARS